MADKTSPILSDEELDNMTTPDPVGGMDVVDRAALGEMEVLRIRLKALRKATACAQLKHTYKWGKGECSDHPNKTHRLRRNCPECWQLLLKKEG